MARLLTLGHPLEHLHLVARPEGHRQISATGVLADVSQPSLKPHKLLPLTEYIEWLQQAHHGVRVPLRGKGRITWVFPGRFQPYHLGHHDIVKKLALRDPSVLVREDANVLMEYEVADIVIGVGSKDTSRADPLTVAQRRKLIHAALDADTDLARVRQNVRTESVPWGTDAGMRLAQMLAQIDPGGEIRFASANPDTLAAARALGLPCVEVQNRESTSERSATKIREAIALGKLEDVKSLLPPAVFELMESLGLFERIKRSWRGG